MTSRQRKGRVQRAVPTFLDSQGADLDVLRLEQIAHDLLPMLEDSRMISASINLALTRGAYIAERRRTYPGIVIMGDEWYPSFMTGIPQDVSVVTLRSVSCAEELYLQLKEQTITDEDLCSLCQRVVDSAESSAAFLMACTKEESSSYKIVTDPFVAGVKRLVVRSSPEKREHFCKMWEKMKSIIKNS